MHFEVEAVLREQRVQTGVGARHVLGAMELNLDADGLVFAASVQELLRQLQIHADIHVVQLFEAHIHGFVHEEADNIGRALGRRGQEIDARCFVRGRRLNGLAIARRQLRQIDVRCGCIRDRCRFGLWRRGTIGDLERLAQAEDARHSDADDAMGLVVVAYADIVRPAEAQDAVFVPSPHFYPVRGDEAGAVKGLRRVEGKISGDAKQRHVRRDHRDFRLELRIVLDQPHDGLVFVDAVSGGVARTEVEIALVVDREVAAICHRAGFQTDHDEGDVFAEQDHGDGAHRDGRCGHQRAARIAQDVPESDFEKHHLPLSVRCFRRIPSASVSPLSGKGNDAERRSPTRNGRFRPILLKNSALIAAFTV